MHKSKATVRYSISKKDQEIISDPNVFLRRTPPPDNESHTTMSDVSYISAADRHLSADSSARIIIIILKQQRTFNDT
ncbi:hypothetical protein RhiirC2_744273 [Rhizophagus irregularis]|uniref:Uncharacterized protein n=1 Tax=Rhizophagus irregularis TaxID=588596 RepID=A0A2N1NCL8_9GLOM|nr:hypothetical protein RhiirC2_744273 [Rhizophagus irregularis]